MGRLIDADILIVELQESAFHHCNNPREDSLLQRDRVIVRAQPTVEAVPVIHAKWDKGYTFPDGAYWKCTNCGELIKVKVPMHYCSNCGAKMDGGEKPSLQR